MNKVAVIEALLQGNPNFYENSNKNEIRCNFEKSLYMSSDRQVDLIIAKKNSNNVWILQESPYSQALNGFLEVEHYTGEASALIEELKKNLLFKIEEVIVRERQDLNAEINKNIQSLSILMEKWTKVSAQTLKESVASKPKDRVEGLFMKQLNFLNENKVLLSKKEELSLNDFNNFFNALKNSAHSEQSFNELKTFCKG